MNHSIAEITIATVAGFGLGVAYFGTLWIAVRHAVRTQSAALVAGTSLIRLSALVGGIWLATRADWQLVLACLVALLVGRQCIFFATSRFAKETVS